MYRHHRITCKPLCWQETADRIAGETSRAITGIGGSLYGVWRSQIGRPRDEVTVVTIWPDEALARSGDQLFSALPTVLRLEAESMTPTVRPTTAASPRRQGNYAFRWFETPPEHWDEFLQLCEGAWPDFEQSYDSQIIGLWRIVPDRPSGIRSLLMTRRPDLGMWERSKLPANAVEAEVRRKLSRRYDLCTDTVVYTSTLLTAEDRQDTARWT